MSCFPCFQSNNEEENNDETKEEHNQDLPVAKPKELDPTPPPTGSEGNDDDDDSAQDPLLGGENDYSSTKNFTFRELAMATKHFRQECLLGEGGFGRIFKGTLQGSGKIVAVRQLDKNGVEEGTHFVMEIAKLNLVEHQNLVKLVGYCSEGDQRLLVYEYMPLGALTNHLFDLPPEKESLDWSTRMKIALGIAQGLEYLHEEADPPIIYRDLKPSNILLDNDYNPHLSKYGLANLVRTGNRMLVSPAVMTSEGYCAPEYQKNAKLTVKADVYSFGVVLLELISGRKAVDPTRPVDEQNLVDWAQPIFKDQAKFIEMADPLLGKKFPATSLNQAVGVAAMCLQEALARPLISDISGALGFLATAKPETPIPTHLVPILSGRAYSMSSSKQENSSESEDGEEEEEEEEESDLDNYSSYSGSDYERGESSDNYSDSEATKKNIACPSKSHGSKKMNSISKHKSTKDGAVSRKRSNVISKSSKVHSSLSRKSSLPDECNTINEQPSNDGDGNSSSSDEEPKKS